MTARRLFELSSGFCTWKATDYAFDYLLYPFVIWKLGPLYGGLLMSVLSLAACLMLLAVYDKLRRDWLGIEFLKQQREYQGTSRYRRVLAWMLNRGDGLAFIALSLKHDPFITTAYLRKNAFGGMTRHDWAIFLGSWLVANGTWLFLCAGWVAYDKHILLATS